MAMQINRFWLANANWCDRCKHTSSSRRTNYKMFSITRSGWAYARVHISQQRRVSFHLTKFITEMVIYLISVFTLANCLNWRIIETLTNLSNHIHCQASSCAIWARVLCVLMSPYFVYVEARAYVSSEHVPRILQGILSGSKPERFKLQPF